MRFLPVFLDLQAGPVLLVGAGELARVKLRLLAAANARVRWYATDGHHDVSGLESADVARIELAEGDPLTADLGGVIAILCAGAGELGPAMSARAKAVGLPVNVMDDLAHSTFIFPAIVDRGDVVVAVGTGGASPVVARRVRESVEAMLPARIGDLAGFIGRWRKPIHDRIAEMPLRRRFWERVIDGPIGALVLAGRLVEAEAALQDIRDPADFAGALASGQAEGRVTLVGAGPAIRICSRSRRCARCRTPTSCSTTNWCHRRFSIAPAATRRACRSAAASASPASARTRSTGC